MAHVPRCPDCNQNMDAGFIPDFSYAQVLQMLWHPGTPEDQRFLGLKTGSVKIDRSEARKIIAYRCPGCGLVRSYAP